MARLSNEAKAHYSNIARQMLTFTAEETESVLKGFSEQAREFILREIFSHLREASKAPKGNKPHVSYIQPKVWGMMREKGGRIALLLNGKVAVYNTMKEALWAFEIERMIHGEHSLTTEVITDNRLAADRAVVRSFKPIVPKKKEVKICISAESAN